MRVAQSAAPPLWTHSPVGICALSDGKLIGFASLYISFQNNDIPVI